ncbi:MAG: imm11 family protein [Hyalangium sp.]|uniref:imm11 family protein n=1 Tax=Hyalangium sp. TaxID=2028555 RepID=UPI00389A8FBA
MRFFKLSVLGDSNDEDLCVLYNSVEGIGLGDGGLHSGERVGDRYPEDARIYMSKESPGIKLSSLLGNVKNFLVVSRDFKEAVEKLCGGKVEYLPFMLYDHRKRVHSRDYFILNPLGTFDCLDLKKSDIKWDEDDSNKIIRIREQVLDRKKMKDAPQLFRIARDPTAYVVGVELAREIYDRDFTNVIWTELRFNDQI